MSAAAEARGAALRRLAVHASHYSLASLLTTVAGLISFPLLTRVFSVADYGMMSIIGVTVTVTVGLGKLGVQHSVLRYHADVAAGRSPYSLAQLSSTAVLGMVATGLLAAAGVLIATHVAPASVLGDPRVRALLGIMSLAIVAQVVGSALVNFTRAEMRTGVLVAYQVGKKWLGLGLILLAVFVVARNLTAFYTATVAGEVLAVVALALALFGRNRIPRPTLDGFSPPLMKEMLAYGIPMLFGNELSGIVLAVGDRYVIRALIGDEPLGLYSAAYNLCEYVQLVVISSVGQAVMPIYMDMWSRQGRDATVAFVERSLRTYVLIGAPVVAGLAAVGPELLPALASSKYASATAVLPWVVAGMVMDGMTPMLGAGLFIARRTRRIMAIVMGSAALNIGLNVVLVPRWGIIGPAVATLVCYAGNALLLGAAGRRFLPVRLPWRTAARSGAVSLAMYGAVARLLPGHGLVTVGVRAAAGAALYGLVIRLIDPDAREVIGQVLRRLRRAV